MTNSETLAAADQLARAEAIATIAHRGQVDKAGQPYLGHVQRVASGFEGTRWRERCIALLHDTIEDTDITAADLVIAGMQQGIVDAVVLLTRVGDGDGYYARIRANQSATLVKLADIADNTNPERVARLERLDPAHAAKLKAKYEAAIAALTGGAHD